MNKQTEQPPFDDPAWDEAAEQRKRQIFGDQTTEPESKQIEPQHCGHCGGELVWGFGSYVHADPNTTCLAFGGAQTIPAPTPEAPLAQAVVRCDGSCGVQTPHLKSVCDKAALRKMYADDARLVRAVREDTRASTEPAARTSENIEVYARRVVGTIFDNTACDPATLKRVMIGRIIEAEASRTASAPTELIEALENCADEIQNIRNEIGLSRTRAERLLVVERQARAALSAAAADAAKGE